MKKIFRKKHYNFKNILVKTIVSIEEKQLHTNIHYNLKMVSDKDLGEVKQALEESKDSVVREINDPLVENESRKEILFGGAIIVSVIAVSIITNDPFYMVAAVTGALGFWLWVSD